MVATEMLAVESDCLEDGLIFISIIDADGRGSDLVFRAPLVCSLVTATFRAFDRVWRAATTQMPVTIAHKFVVRDSAALVAALLDDKSEWTAVVPIGRDFRRRMIKQTMALRMASKPEWKVARCPKVARRSVWCAADPSQVREAAEKFEDYRREGYVAYFADGDRWVPMGEFKPSLEMIVYAKRHPATEGRLFIPTFRPLAELFEVIRKAHQGEDKGQSISFKLDLKVEQGAKT
jgi:hypothetical protein